MKIAVGSDEKTYLTDKVLEWLKDKGYEVSLFGHLVDEGKKWKWVDIGKEVAELVASGKAVQGIVFCWSGTGICMAANKIKGIRAALCFDAGTAKLARKWDDANVLCLSLRYTSETMAREILETWFSTAFDEEGLNQAHKLDTL